MSATDGSISLEIVHRVANACNTAPENLTPLHTAIDCDALEALVDSNFRGTCEFFYEGCRVVVDGDGSVQAAPNDGCVTDAPV